MSDKEKVYRVAMLHAANLLMAQLVMSLKDSNISSATDECTVTIDGGHQHIVKGLVECDCTHFLTTGLPCAHIFVAQDHEGQVKFVSDLVPQRWQRTYSHCMNRIVLTRVMFQ